MRSIKAISSRTNESSCSSPALWIARVIEKCLFRVGHYTTALVLLLSDAHRLLTRLYRAGHRCDNASRGWLEIVIERLRRMPGQSGRKPCSIYFRQPCSWLLCLGIRAGPARKLKSHSSPPAESGHQLKSSSPASSKKRATK